MSDAGAVDLTQGERQLPEPACDLFRRHGPRLLHDAAEVSAAEQLHRHECDAALLVDLCLQDLHQVPRVESHRCPCVLPEALPQLAAVEQSWRQRFDDAQPIRLTVRGQIELAGGALRCPFRHSVATSEDLADA